jgi:AcrR family transcriptional regulator
MGGGDHVGLLWVNVVFIDWNGTVPGGNMLVKSMYAMFIGMPTTPRRYELKERARRQEETRRRIVDATVALHREVGPARTTIAEVARRAGVGRVTVYNHFPDDVSLIAACSAHFVEGHPPPDPGAWAAIDDPDERLRTALAQAYGYYRENAPMLVNVARDAALVPALAEVLGRSGAVEHAEAMRDALLAGRGLRGGKRRRVRAMIDLALDLATWQRLTGGGGLSDAEAVDVMAAAVRAAD